MEDSGEIQQDENGAFRKESNKKMIKTPSQIEALKEIYRVNKYPTEEIRFGVAQKLGLTEKQVRNWFCNRRVRDRRALSLKDEARGDQRQDRSNGVVPHDRASGFGQDSSGSTKQGSSSRSRRPPVDLRDVESRTLHGQDSPSPDLNYELRSHYPENTGGADDTTSESSSALQEGCCPRSMDRYDIRSCTFGTSHRIGTPSGSNSFKDNGINYKPSGYLKLKGEIEHAAITAVKRQLGSHYREGGPPICIQFQPLPPGAFESAGRQSAYESYYDEDPAMSHSCDIHRVHDPPGLNSRWEFYDSQASPQKSYEEDLNSSPVDMSDDYDDQPHFHLKQKRTFSRCFDHLAGTSSALHMHGHLVSDVFGNGDGMNRSSSSNHSAEIMRSNHLRATGTREPRHYECDSMGPKVVHSSNKSREKPPDPVVWGNYHTNAEGGGQSIKLSKAVKQIKNKVPKRGCNAVKTPADLPQWRYTVPAEMRSRLSDDEAAATSSSLD